MSKTPIPDPLAKQVAKDARRRCGYCLSQQRYLAMPLEFDHLKPESQGGRTVRNNLWLACTLCNKHKAARTHAPDPDTGRLVRLFNPRGKKQWREHFRWVQEGVRIEGLTPTGRATVAALQLNRIERVITRRAWVSAGWHPPED